MLLKCKECLSKNYVKNGIVHGKQRYKCRDCGRNFTDSKARGKPEAIKSLAVLLYGIGAVSQGMIAKILNVSHVSVYRWVRAAGESVEKPDPKIHNKLLILHEMWHFVDGKKPLLSRMRLRSSFGASGRLGSR
jgi:transposase-like protein